MGAGTHVSRLHFPWTLTVQSLACCVYAAPPMVVDAPFLLISCAVALAISFLRVLRFLSGASYC